MPSARDRLMALFMHGFYDERQHGLAAELGGVGEQFETAAQTATNFSDEDERERLHQLAMLMLDASSALQGVTDQCNKVLDRVGPVDDTEQPVAAALRDLALKINRLARGKAMYL